MSDEECPLCGGEVGRHVSRHIRLDCPVDDVTGESRPPDDPGHQSGEGSIRSKALDQSG